MEAGHGIEFRETFQGAVKKYYSLDLKSAT